MMSDISAFFVFRKENVVKKTNIKIASIFLLLILICTVTGCSSNTDALSEPQYAPPLFYQIKTDKAQYTYGEEVTIEFLFGKNINYNTKEIVHIA